MFEQPFDAHPEKWIHSMRGRSLQQACWVALAVAVSLASRLLARKIAGRPDAL